jgi:hypothetical protein
MSEITSRMLRNFQNLKQQRQGNNTNSQIPDRTEMWAKLERIEARIGAI